MDIPDDSIQPAGPAPVAVVRRQGEGLEQMQLRKQGYTADHYDSSASTRRGSGESYLARSARLSLARDREKRMSDQNDQQQKNFEREQDLKAQQFSMQQRIHESSQEDHKTALQQVAYMMDEQDQLAQQFGRGTREYMLGALSIAKKYPAAIMADPRLGQQLNHYDSVLTNAGVSDNVKQAVSEIGQADPTRPDMLGYLDTIPGKYPEIVNDPHIMSMFTGKRREAAAAQLKRDALASGLHPDKATVNEAGGSMTLGNPKADTTEIKFLERERNTHQIAFDKASARRQRAEASGSQDLKAAADEDIVDAKAKLAEVDSQIRTYREGKADAKPDAKVDPYKITSAKEFHDLPSGAEFIDPQGVKRRKP